MTDLPTLLTRIEAASADDAELFAEIAMALVGWRKDDDAENPERRALWLRLHVLLDARAFESAALSLCERVLEGWEWKISSDNGDGASEAWLFDPLARYAASAEAPTPALALLAAVVKAKMEVME